jgi:zinc transporter, ZIP family
MLGALWWGLVAGSAFVVGGLLALHVVLPSRTIGLLMGFGGGALFAAVAYELVDEAGRLAGGSGRVAIGLVIGSLAYLLATGGWTDDAEDHVSTRSLVTIVVPEAVIIVGSLLAGHHISAAIITAVFLCGVPEAFVATRRLRSAGRDAQVLLLWTALAACCGVSALITYAVLDGAGSGTVAIVLAIAGGAVLTELSTELLPEGHDLGGRLVGTAVVVGFALVFALVEFA